MKLKLRYTAIHLNDPFHQRNVRKRVIMSVCQIIQNSFSQCAVVSVCTTKVHGKNTSATHGADKISNIGLYKGYPFIMKRFINLRDILLFSGGGSLCQSHFHLSPHTNFSICKGNKETGLFGEHESVPLFAGQF